MAEIKYTSRMALTDIINGTNTDKVKAWAENEIAKLDKKNAKRKAEAGQVKEENKPIAEAIIKALAEGGKLSVELAEAIGQSVQKTNGVAGEMCKIGTITKSKVKVKGKGEQTLYTLAEATEEVAEEVAE